MAKKTTTQPRKKRHIILKVIVILLVIIAGLIIYTNWNNQRLAQEDRQKFMTLKSDMLQLQTEFNKIDAGWEYSEGCNDKGEVFRHNEASSCHVDLIRNNPVASQEYVNLISSSGDYSNIDRYEFMDDQVMRMGYSMRYTKHKTVKCGFDGKKSQDKDGLLSFGCSASALEFYFPKTQ